MNLITRSITGHDPATTSFTGHQNRSVLIAGLTCACFSVLATLITLRWFILMKRNFRHQLVMFLICSDTFKAFWYFLFPVVVFARGPVQSSSGFCQATGFFLSVGIEASDFAILMIALHSILYIFHPPTSSGEVGGLYPWRKWIYPAWICLPILAASLAFINDHDAYITVGTFCYLPRRPFWYRLALSWIPRYFIFCIIFMMYTAVYVYVTLKFRSFSNLQDSNSRFSSTSQSRRSSIDDDDIAPDEPARPLSSMASPKRSRYSRPTFSRSGSYIREHDQPAENVDPWDEVSFITSKPLRTSGIGQSGVLSSDFASGSTELSSASGAKTPQVQNVSNRLEVPPVDSRKSSDAPTTGSHMSHLTGTTTTTTTNPHEVNPRQLSSAVQKLATTPREAKPTDPLKRTRRAIRKQLRYMFIYPALYLLMWIFPFAAHCTLYDDYYVQHPIYWLTIISTCTFSLQAGADCVVFSWREKPWRRIADNNKFTFNGIRRSFSIRNESMRDRSAVPSIAIAPDEERGITGKPATSGKPGRNTSDWWEAEGLKRKDSVWLGTDSSNVVADYEEEHDIQQHTGANIPGTIMEEHEPASPNGHPPEILMPGRRSNSPVPHDKM